jgi:hypothetical protein
MPMVTPTLNLPQPPASSSTKSAAPAAAPAATVAATAPAAKAPDAPSATVTLSPQAMSAAWAASHPTASSSSAGGATPTPPVAPAHDASLYESLKNGISTAVTDVGDAIAGGARAVVESVETTLSTANDIVKGTLELPFAAVSKGCDAVGALIDEL